MNRREFIQCAALLISGASASQLGFTLSSEQTVYLATAPNYSDSDRHYLSAAQKQTLAMLTETIIPRTETPGAIDARVPRFVELMVFEWLNEAERSIFIQGLQSLMEDTRERFAKAFELLDEATRVGILEALEDEASDSPWYNFGEVERDFISDAPFICQLKELTIWGFFTSEVGGSQVLRYEAMPMQFDGHRTLGADDSSWSAPLT